LQDEPLVRAVLEDPQTSPLPEAEKALFGFIDKVNHDAPRIGPADIESLHAAGWSDEAIYLAITVCALFNFYNRWIDASGVQPQSPETHRASAKKMAQFGYIRTSPGS
jgi:alkylhydroperoxidase family enzyme